MPDSSDDPSGAAREALRGGNGLEAIRLYRRATGCVLLEAKQWMHAERDRQAAEMAPLTFTYRNYRGEVDQRRVMPISVRFGSTEWHPEPQWLLRAHDFDKQAEREFAMKDICAAQRPASDGWRPIETAPKDGEVIDLWSAVHQSRWPNMHWFDGAWYGNRMRYQAHEFEPTHWRPLPSPPEARTGVSSADEEAEALRSDKDYLDQLYRMAAERVAAEREAIAVLIENWVPQHELNRSIARQMSKNMAAAIRARDALKGAAR